MNLNITKFPESLAAKLKMKALVDKTTLRQLVINLLTAALK